jgi:hypothetical protein
MPHVLPPSTTITKRKKKFLKKLYPTRRGNITAFSVRLTIFCWTETLLNHSFQCAWSVRSSSAGDGYRHQFWSCVSAAILCNSSKLPWEFTHILVLIDTLLNFWGGPWSSPVFSLCNFSSSVFFLRKSNLLTPQICSSVCSNQSLQDFLRFLSMDCVLPDHKRQEVGSQGMPHCLSDLLSFITWHVVCQK